MIATVIGRAALRTRMRDAKISGMVDQIGIAVFGNMAAAGTLALLVWDKTDPRLLVIWPVAIGAVTAGLRHSDLEGGQQDARMLFENLARTNAFLDTVAQTPPTP